MEDVYLKQLSKMKRPIPGMSLTNDPESPAPFEGPPEFTKKKDALEAIFSGLIEPDVYSQLIESLANGAPVINVTQVLLYEGFRQGKWNPDLFLLLIEPTAYMIMALAERAGLDPVVDNEEEDEEEELSAVKNKFETIQKSLSKVKKGVLPREIEQKIEKMPAPESLLSKPPAGEMEDGEEEEDEMESLITRP